MSATAGHCNRVRALAAIAASPLLTDDQFRNLAGQDKITLPRDLEYAERDFAQAKANYERHCAEIGAPAYTNVWD